MPFNRDLIESGCTLKTYNGDLSILERVIDYTVNKPTVSSQPVETKAEVFKRFTSIPATQKELCMPRQARRIKEVVYGEHLDELSWSEGKLATCPVSTTKTADTAASNISAAGSGFCFRHTMEEDIEPVGSTVPGVSATAASQPILSVHESKKMQTTCTESNRVARCVKDAVYGDGETERPFGQSSYSHQTCDVPQHPVKHFKFCMHDSLSTDSVPASVAVTKQAFDMPHAHWRSAIHGF